VTSKMAIREPHNKQLYPRFFQISFYVFNFICIPFRISTTSIHSLPHPLPILSFITTLETEKGIPCSINLIKKGITQHEYEIILCV
jgi:hypothetical protein